MIKGALEREPSSNGAFFEFGHFPFQQVPVHTQFHRRFNVLEGFGVVLHDLERIAEIEVVLTPTAIGESTTIGEDGNDNKTTAI